MRSANEWAIDLRRMPRFSYAIVASICQSRDARSFDGLQLHLRSEFSPHACPARIRGSCVVKCQRIRMALRVDSIRGIPSCLGLLYAEEIWSQLRNWGASRDRIRCNSSDWDSYTAHISTERMDLGGTPSHLVGFLPGTRNRSGLGSCSAGVGSICCNCESRDRLLGRGKELALLAFTVLCIILALSLLTTSKSF